MLRKTVMKCILEQTSASMGRRKMYIVNTACSHNGSLHMGTFYTSDMVMYMLPQPHVSDAVLPMVLSSWQAFLLVMDNRPFPDLRHIILDQQDERIQVFAEWVRQ